MFLMVIVISIGLSVLASVLVLTAVIRGAQIDQMARDGMQEEESISPEPSSAPHAPEPHPPTPYAPGRVSTPEQEWGAPVRASRFTSDDKL